MNMIEVDPKLFIKCRLCLEETGVYQIVPDVQKRIKYCFDLDIVLFDGLPPLICKSCESMLSRHTNIKQKLHEKQERLINRFKGNPTQECFKVEIQSPTNSTKGLHFQNNDKPEDVIKIADTNKKQLSKNEHSVIIEESSNSVEFSNNIIKKRKSPKREWQRNYSKQFICRYCSISLGSKQSIIFHRQKCTILARYSEILKWCWVKLDNCKSTNNLTELTENVVFDENKIINAQNPYYCVVYSLKSKRPKKSSVSSDENFTHRNRKYKRQRLLSQSSNETTIIDCKQKEENNKLLNSSSNLPATTDTECVMLDDSDDDISSTLSDKSTKYTNVDTTPENFNRITIEKMINNIVSICYNKYLKRYNIGEKNVKNSDDASLLQHKLLSIGRKTIHKEGFNPTGLLRYMEQKDLDVVWIQKSEANVTVKTTLKDCNKDEKNVFKSLTEIDKTYKPKDFVDIFEKLSTPEAGSTNSTLIFGNDKTIQEEVNNKDKNVSSNNNCSSNDDCDNCNVDKGSGDSFCGQSVCLTTEKILNTYENKMKNYFLGGIGPKKTTTMTHTKKLLNTSPVSNPKTLIKKDGRKENAAMMMITPNTNNNDAILSSTAPSAEKFIDKNVLPLPIITSTVSLASLTPSSKNNQDESASCKEHNAPSKAPESSMPRIKVKPFSELMAKVPDRPKGFSVPTSVWAGNSNEEHIPCMPTILPNLLTPAPVYVGLMQPNNPNSGNHPHYPTSQMTTNSIQSEPLGKTTIDYLTMHTVELPRTRTSAPYQYFKDLLRIHNIDLIDHSETISYMSCIIKFKLHYEQSGKEPVTLCLSLFCYRNTFLIQMRDLKSRVLNMNEFSTYWQWEVLKGFKGDVLALVLQNAKKISLEMFEQTKKFVTLLNNIVVIR